MEDHSKHCQSKAPLTVEKYEWEAQSSNPEILEIILKMLNFIPVILDFIPEILDFILEISALITKVLDFITEF